MSTRRAFLQGSAALALLPAAALAPPPPAPTINGYGLQVRVDGHPIALTPHALEEDALLLRLRAQCGPGQAVGLWQAYRLTRHGVPLTSWRAFPGGPIRMFRGDSAQLTAATRWGRS